MTELSWIGLAMTALPPTKFAGANEVRRNILANSVLGLAVEDAV